MATTIAEKILNGWCNGRPGRVVRVVKGAATGVLWRMGSSGPGLVREPGAVSHEVPTSGSGEPRPSYCEYYDENHASWVKIATTQWGLQQADAEDVVQDAFKEARSEWEEIENPGAWMRQKIEWRASDCRKKNSRRQAHECDADADTLPTGVASTEERILARDRLGRLGRIISQLSEQDQRHVRLMAVHASSEDTAIALGMTPGTERARRCRLRKRLARLLHDAEDQK